MALISGHLFSASDEVGSGGAVVQVGKMNEQPTMGCSPAELQALEVAVSGAFRHGSTSGLEILGYGEISTVFASRGETGAWACKRLPAFADRDAWKAYQQCLDAYIAALGNCGVRVVDSRFETTPDSRGNVAVYCFQPLLTPAQMAHRVVVEAERKQAEAVFAGILDHIFDVVSPVLGLDAQLSNWAMIDGKLLYLDLSTPLMRTSQGQERLDVALYLASMPWALRALARRYLIEGVVARYYEARLVVLDLIANLPEDGLDDWTPWLLQAADTRLVARGLPPLSTLELARHREIDARNFVLTQRLRGMQQWWQRRVRGQPYPFILPEPKRS